MSTPMHTAPQPPHSNASTISLQNFATSSFNLLASPSSSSETSSSSSSHTLYDITTARSLSLVSREMSDQVSPIVWHSISITRPTSLYALLQTLLAKPSRAALIKSLHIGPQEVLPPQWFPLSQGSVYDHGHKPGAPLKWISTSLSSAELPSGFKDFQLIALDGQPLGCREAAIRDALNVAQHSFNATLFAGVQTIRPAIGIGSMLEVQAALDIYLAKLKTTEDENPDLILQGQPGVRAPLRCRSGRCNHYPALAIINLPGSSRRDPSRNAFAVSYSQLIRHIARPGSATDRFDHPVIFERSGIRSSVFVPSLWLAKSEYHRGVSYRLTPETAELHESREVEFWPQLAHLREEDRISTSAGREALNAAVVNTATIAANLRLARAVLALISNLGSLSFTGFLERTLDGQQSVPFLRRVSFGPPPFGWGTKRLPGAMDGIEDLRICGIDLEEDEVAAVVRLPRLRRFEWSYAEECSSLHSKRIVAETVQRLIQTDLSSTTAAHQKFAANNSDSAPLVVVRLHPDAITHLLSTAPSLGVQEAWVQGTRPPVTAATPRQPRTLLLLKHCGPSVLAGPLPPSGDSTSRYWEEMYEEGKLWRRG